MQRNCLVAIVSSIVVLIVGFACESKPSPAEGTEILKITIGEPTSLSTIGLQNTSSATISRTGVVAVFYPSLDHPGFENQQISVQRVSNDAGQSWGQERRTVIGGGKAGVALREGGVIRSISHSFYLRDSWPLVSFMARFSDDFSNWTVEPASIDLPNPALTAQEPSPHTWAGPIMEGKMVQLPNGDVLATLQGRLKGDIKGRVLLVKSSDQGRTWHYYSTVGYEDEDPNPELPGEFGGFAEAALAMLGNGQMVCAMRAQSSHLPPDYKPLYISWSDDLGKTWTKPVPSKPHLMNIWPSLHVLDNGVLACIYGRPGFHVVFSTDNGHTWGNRISFSHLPVSQITGQVDGNKAGPNKLVAVGGLGGNLGTKVFPITVELVKDPSPGPFELVGQVLDEQGNPIAGATVEYGPNRYTTDYKPILADNGHPTVKTDGEGRFFFDGVKRGETMLTVEADGYVPTLRHVKAQPGMEPVAFRLKAGQMIRGRVVDEKGRTLMGACVIIGETEHFNPVVDSDDWHVHTDSSGRFGLAVAGTAPESVTVRLVKRHYLHRSITLSLSQIQKDPLAMPRLEYPETGPDIKCIAVDTAPPVDAGFDDPAWAKAPVASEFRVKSASTAKSIPVKARFAYDKTYLYAIMRVEPGEGVSLSDEDMLELYIAKDMDHRWNFQFAYNVKGRIPGRFAWNCPWPKYHVRREADGGWTISTAIWWLQLDVKDPGPIGVGIAHLQALEGEQEAEASSTQAAPPAVLRYGRLVLK